jgi:hypothetical protein
MMESVVGWLVIENKSIHTVAIIVLSSATTNMLVRTANNTKLTLAVDGCSKVSCGPLRVFASSVTARSVEVSRFSDAVVLGGWDWGFACSARELVSFSASMVKAVRAE